MFDYQDGNACVNVQQQIAYHNIFILAQYELLSTPVRNSMAKCKFIIIIFPNSDSVSCKRSLLCFNIYDDDDMMKLNYLITSYTECVINLFMSIYINFNLTPDP